MTLTDEVRAHCAQVAWSARSVTIDDAALEAYAAEPRATLDPELHVFDGPPEELARHMLTIDAVNFGSGWFPTLRKADGRSGYATITAALTERARREGPWTNAQLRALDTAAVADALGQRRDHALMALYAQALRALGGWLGERGALDAVDEAGGSAEAFASALAAGMAMFRDR